VPTRGEHLNGARPEVDDEVDEGIRYTSPLTADELRYARAKLAYDIVALMVRDLEPAASRGVHTALATALAAVQALQAIVATEERGG
jgi:hypothetical protein